MGYWPLIIYGLVVLALLSAELREDQRGQIFFKPLAALGFILLAIYVGALDSPYGQIILAGLVACAMGDVLLLSRKSRFMFLCGMLAFAAGHMLYSLAFFDEGLHFNLDGVSVVNRPIGIPVIITFSIASTFAIYFMGKAERMMRIPIAIYTFVIAVMVSMSFLVEVKAIIAAIMFAASDMFVAKDRFVRRGPNNALAITPLYFGAQALFALSTAI